MINKKFSLEVAYGFGLKTVFSHFFFFFISIFIGSVACAAYLATLGVIDFYALHQHGIALMKMFHHVMAQATGPLHHAALSVHDVVHNHLPHDVASVISSKDVISIDVSHADMQYILWSLLPMALAIKLFVDVISVGWTKIALDLQSKKSVDYSYLYEFYYLVPRVFVVNLLVGIVTALGTMLFIVPGIFVFQRLRFTKYFIIDKNQDMLESLKSSWSMTDGSVISLFMYTILSLVVTSLGYSLVLATLVVYPLYYLVDASVYRQMVGGK